MHCRWWWVILGDQRETWGATNWLYHIYIVPNPSVQSVGFKFWSPVRYWQFYVPEEAFWWWKWHVIGPRHSVWVTFIIRHQLHSTWGPHFLELFRLREFWCILEGEVLVIFITLSYYFPPHLVVVPWGHASEGCYKLLAPPCATLWLFVIFYVVRPLIEQF